MLTRLGGEAETKRKDSREGKKGMLANQIGKEESFTSKFTEGNLSVLGVDLKVWVGMWTKFVFPVVG